MRRGILIIACVLAAAFSDAALDKVVLLDPAIQKVLDHDPIFIHTSGHTAVDFATIVLEMGRSNLLVRVQQTYARMLPAGKQPEFIIHQSSSNSYFYENRSGERSDIREVLRQRLAPDSIRCVYHVTGRRFFGPFESVIQVDVQPVETGVTGYVVDVYAYPEVTLARFLARHLPLVDHYFQSKTRDVITLVAGVLSTNSH